MKIPLFDAHCDTAMLVHTTGARLRENSGHVDLLRGSAYRPRAQFFAIFNDSAETENVTAAMLAQLTTLQRELRENADIAELCTTASEARAAFKAGRTAAFISVEGAEQLGCSETMLRAAFDLGVRAVNLTWNHANELSGSNVEEPERGLSEKGRDFVRCCQALGVIVDVSHLSEAGFWDVMELSNRPVMASHSNAKALCAHPRNLTDEQFKALVKTGGVAGINLYGDFLGGRADLDRAAEHIEHFLSLGGEKAVALGADLDGCDLLPEGINGVQDMYKLYELLLKRNFSQRLVDDIFFHNLFGMIER